MAHDTPLAAHLQRSLRHCLAVVAEHLYAQGHAPEIISLPHQGLTADDLRELRQHFPDWATCEQVLNTSQAATLNRHQRLVLTDLGRQLMFDMFGEGAADCA